MRIVQISDLHIGGLFKQEAFDTLVNEVNNDLRPNLIVLSGDLTDDGLVFQLKKAQDEIKKFDCKDIIIFPGNHDYRHTGYLIFKKFFPSSLKRVHEFDNGKIVLVTVNTARPDRDEGEIGRSQILWMENTLSKYEEYTEYENIPRLKIVCMHHHLISIPDTGYTNVVGISDAGDALRACLESGVDLVICGHKHRPWMWNLGKVLIVYAGTACSWRYRGVFDDTYNIIDIKNNKVHVDIKMVGGKKVPLLDIVKRFKQQVRTQALPS